MFNKIKEVAGKIFGRVTDFFMSVAKSTIGQMVYEIHDTAEKVVENIEKENGNLSNHEKWEIAYSTIKKQFPHIRDAAINLAIEMAVALMKQKMLKRIL